jgi:antitoxin Phd
MKKIWQLQEAKNRFSELIDRVHSEGAQKVTRRGKEVAVIISPEEFNRLVGPTDDLVSFFARSPLTGDGITLERDRSAFRDTPL